MNKALEIIQDKEDKKMFQSIIDLIEKTYSGMTPIQIENFVLNDIEFPTPYGKFEQAKFELVSRYQQLVDLYYEIKEREIKIKQQERKIEKAKDDLEKELLELQKEKLEIQIVNLKRRLKTIIGEAKVFYRVYQEHPEFHKLTPEKAFQLEAENWARKTLNMPTIFEERYGKDYMIKALGEENYQKYLELRRKNFGLLPREMFEVKQLKEK